MQHQMVRLKAKVDEYYSTQSESSLYEVCALLNEVKRGKLSEVEADFVNFVDVRIPIKI